MRPPEAHTLHAALLPGILGGRSLLLYGIQQTLYFDDASMCGVSSDGIGLRISEIVPNSDFFGENGSEKTRNICL